MRDEDKWRCPWCGLVATTVRESVVCDSRRCDCGAVAIGAPEGDWDEATDEAIDLFGIVARPESRGVDALLREDIRRSGVEVRPGPRDPDMGHPWGWAYVYAWFRRLQPTAARAMTGRPRPKPQEVRITDGPMQEPRRASLSQGPEAERDLATGHAFMGPEMEQRLRQANVPGSKIVELPPVDVTARARPKQRFTVKQGQYLSFIYYYGKIHGRPPAEADLQRYFRVSAPAVHQMVVTLEAHALIDRTPGQARSIRLRVSRAELPDLE